MLLRSVARRCASVEALCSITSSCWFHETHTVRRLATAVCSYYTDAWPWLVSTSRSDHNLNAPSRRNFSGTTPKEPGEELTSGIEADNQSQPPSASSTLMNALDKLVGAAAEFVEEGKLSEAISVLTEGIGVLEGPFPKSTEVGELHNQVALLLLFSDKAVEAEQHAVKALEITQEMFGPRHILTAKRMLRLGAVHTALAKAQEAFNLLSTAREILQVDSMKFAVDIAEVDFFTALLKMSAASSPGDVLDLQPELLASFKILCDNLGPESLTVSIALGQQTRTTLNAMDRNFQVAEALFRQEVRLLESSGQKEAAGLTLYKLATFYYANDLYHDGTEALQKATSILRNVLPDDHDLLLLCKHRQGMLCALGGDHRAANKLLRDAQAHYSKMDSNHVLALEAAAGLELARLRELDSMAHASAQELRDVLNKASSMVESMSSQIGPNHMLVQAMNRRMQQLRYAMDHR